MQFLQEVSQFLSTLEAVHSEQAVLFQRKEAALRHARPRELEALVEPETDLTRRLQLLLGRRQRLLQLAGQAGLPSTSIEALATAVGGDELPRLAKRIERAKVQAEQFRRENLVHWIVAQRAHAQYRDLLELIVHRGRKAPTYAGEQPRDAAGGALLDASA